MGVAWQIGSVEVSLTGDRSDRPEVSQFLASPAGQPVEVVSDGVEGLEKT